MFHVLVITNTMRNSEVISAKFYVVVLCNGENYAQNWTHISCNY